MAAARRLRQLLGAGRLVQMPCCYDALSARLVEEAGFPLTFVSGFGAAAAKGLPDTGLVSFGEVRIRTDLPPSPCFCLTVSLDDAFSLPISYAHTLPRVKPWPCGYPRTALKPVT